MYRLAILNSHPIQYFVPFYRRLAQETQIDLTVYFCSSQGLETYFDPGFGQAIAWDTPLLAGYHYEFLPNWRRSSSKKRSFFSLINPAIISELYRGRFDAVVVHGHASLTTILAIGSAKIFSAPVLMRGDSTLTRKYVGLKKILRDFLVGILYRTCDACLVVGTANAEYYKYYGIDESRLFLVPIMVDNSRFARARLQPIATLLQKKQSLGLTNDLPSILFVAKLAQRKRPMDLLLAYHSLVKQGEDANLIMVGTGAEEENLRNYASQNALKNVFFLGFRNQSELPEIYALSDIFVLPSQDEPFGLVVNEAMCASLPIIVSSEVGAAADLVVEGHNGFIYPVGDVDALVVHLHRLLADTDLRQKMGSHSYELIQSWDYERGVQGIKEALQYLHGPEQTKTR